MNQILYTECERLSEHFTSDPQEVNPSLVTILQIKIYHTENATSENKRRAAKKAINRHYGALPLWKHKINNQQ